MSASPHAWLAGRRATVMGLGLFGGGVAATRYLSARGARVTVTDLRPAHELAESLAQLEGLDVDLRLGEHRPEDFELVDLVVANPAVDPAHELLVRARAAGVPVRSEAGLFLEACRARVAAVTGTQGKSSTCNLLAQLLVASGVRAHLGGNVGRPLLAQVDRLAAGDVVVLELSSYQLEALAGEPVGRPAELALVTNVLADHLERHGTVEAYREAKRRVLDLVAPGGTAFAPGDDPRLAEWNAPGARLVRFRSDGARGAADEPCLTEGRFLWRGEVLGRVEDLPLPGAFQRVNALVALCAARALGAAPAALAAALPGVEGLPHRLQDLGSVRGHRVWDNGVSTTPDSTVAALRSLSGPLTLLCGGRRKRLDLDELAREVAARGVRPIAFGADGAELAGAFAARGVAAERVATVEEAVALAFERMAPGEALLFSPAFASFDAYRNFADRARAFRAALPAAAPA